MAVAEDITKNLPSLQFDSALLDEERDLIHLRYKNVALVSSACGQAAYFVAILNEARECIFEAKKSLNKSKSSNYAPLKVGIIGCGRLGKQLATVILEFGRTEPCNLYISTRCPENLEQFEVKGVVCCFDNKMVSKKVDVLFLCCLPSQLQTVSKDLRGNLTCLVYSFIGGTSLAKISQLLNYKKIIKPNFVFRTMDAKESYSRAWKFDKDICEVLQDAKCCSQSCPFSSNEDRLLEDDNKLCELFLCAFLNECSFQGADKYEAIRLCSSIMFGLPSNNPSCLTVEDVQPDKTERNQESMECDNMLPIFDLAKVSSDGTLIGKKILQDDKVLRDAFIIRYRKVFEKSMSRLGCVSPSICCTSQQ